MSSSSEKLSLWQAVLVNVNVMFGSGIFINTVNLNRLAGVFACVSYLIVALMLLPLIFAMMQLIARYPRGGFYVYAAQQLSPFAGFCSAWAYFIGKLASATLLIHVFSLLIQTIIPFLQGINVFCIDLCILAMFMWINHFGIQTGMRVTYAFVICKIMPIIFAILSSIYLMQYWSLGQELVRYQEIPATLPLVLYAFVGFEAACSFSLAIKNPQKNAPRVLLYSFLFTVILTITYQLLTSLAIGATLLTKASFLDVFPSLFAKLLPQTSALTTHLLNLLHIAGAVSALGGSYGMIFSNAWNLYILAEHNHVFYANLFTAKNKFGVPFACVLTEGVLCIGYLLGTHANQIILQQISVLGCSIAFGLSTVALLKLNLARKKSIAPDLIPLLAGASSLFLYIMCLGRLFIAGLGALVCFCGVLLLGMVMFYIQQKPKRFTAF